MQCTPLQLVTPSEYVAARSNVFPSVESLRWFERQHRAELLRQGAIVAPTGRKLVDPAAFDQAVVTIGRRLAESRSRRGTDRGEA